VWGDTIARGGPPPAVKGDDDMQERVIETDMSWYRFMTNPYPRRPADWEGEEDHKAALAKMLSRVPKRQRELLRGMPRPSASLGGDDPRG
jgi:hypothetical protein